MKRALFHRINQIINSDSTYFIVLLLITLLVFARLFYPELKTFITPDIGISDQINLNYSLKYILSNSLKHNQLPWWEPRIANGFPLIAEGQIGAFYIPNLLLFKFLPFAYAFNIGHMLSFFLAALGFYLYIRLYSGSKISACIGALFFSFSAVLFLQITHYNTLQSYCLIPLIFFLLEQNIRHRKPYVWFAGLVFLCAQQFFTGYVMTSAITMIMVILYLFLKIGAYSFKKRILYVTKFMSIFILFFIPLVLVQVIPILQFTLHSTRLNGLGTASLNFSLPLSALSTYINFNFFGSPNTNAYNLVAFISNKTNFWESNLYFGIFPLILTIAGLYVYRRNKIIQFFSALYIITLFFALGINSPLYFLFLLPPLNFFRTPSRFIIFLNFFTMALFTFALSFFLQSIRSFIHHKRLIVLVKLVLFTGLLYSFIQMIYLIYSYHPIASIKQLSKTSISTYLNNNFEKDLLSNKFKIYSLGNSIVWQSSIITEGWKNTNKYLFFLNDLTPYYNSLFDIPSGNVFPGSFFYPKNQYTFQSTIQAQLYNSILDEDNNMFPAFTDAHLFTAVYDKQRTMSDTVIKLLQLKNVKFFITPFNFKDTQDFFKIYELKYVFDRTMYLRVYQIQNPRSRFYFSSSFEKMNNLDSLSRILQATMPANVIISQQDLPPLQNSDAKEPSVYGHIVVDADFSTETTLNIMTDRETYLVDTDSYYPGWVASVDGKQTSIMEVNINQRAIMVPKGSHTVSFRYEPWWINISILISLIANGGILFYLIIAIAHSVYYTYLRKI